MKILLILLPIPLTILFWYQNSPFLRNYLKKLSAKLKDKQNKNVP